MIPDQVLPDISMRACSLAGINLYLVKKTLSKPEDLLTHKIDRVIGGEVRVNSTWVHRDGEENPDYPDYVWIVGKPI